MIFKKKKQISIKKTNYLKPFYIEKSIKKKNLCALILKLIGNLFKILDQLIHSFLNDFLC